MDAPAQGLTPIMFTRTLALMTPQELQKMLDELEASRASRRRAWENLQETRLGAPGFCWYEVAATGQKDDRFGRQAD
jgi:hypothetical protein